MKKVKKVKKVKSDQTQRWQCPTYFAWAQFFTHKDNKLNLLTLGEIMHFYKLTIQQSISHLISYIVKRHSFVFKLNWKHQMYFWAPWWPRNCVIGGKAYQKVLFPGQNWVEIFGKVYEARIYPQKYFIYLFHVGKVNVLLCSLTMKSALLAIRA